MIETPDRIKSIESLKEQISKTEDQLSRLKETYQRDIIDHLIESKILGQYEWTTTTRTINQTCNRTHYVIICYSDELYDTISSLLIHADDLLSTITDNETEITIITLPSESRRIHKTAITIDCTDTNEATALLKDLGITKTRVPIPIIPKKQEYRWENL